jgi:hypothetical protein
VTSRASAVCKPGSASAAKLAAHQNHSYFTGADDDEFPLRALTVTSRSSTARQSCPPADRPTEMKANLGEYTLGSSVGRCHCVRLRMGRNRFVGHVRLRRQRGFKCMMDRTRLCRASWLGEARGAPLFDRASHTSFCSTLCAAGAGIFVGENVIHVLLPSLFHPTSERNHLSLCGVIQYCIAERSPGRKGFSNRRP